MIAGVLEISPQEMRTMRLTDSYSVHRIVYSLFDDQRAQVEKKGSTPSGFLFVDKGMVLGTYKILFLSDRMPRQVDFGNIRIKQIPDNFLSADTYRFEVVINPTKRDSATGKLVAVKGRQQIQSWFENKSAFWGFCPVSTTTEVKKIEVVRFKKDESHTVVLEKATVTGVLKVTDRQLFIKSFTQGIGRAKAFGCGLLQIVPI